jgi:hypothetical protein
LSRSLSPQHLFSTKYLPSIVKAYLLKRLVSKFGWDDVSSFVTKFKLKMHKRLKNMRKELDERRRYMKMEMDLAKCQTRG